MAPTAENEKQLIESLRTGLFIDGTWRDASNGATFEVEDPATGEVLTTVANATPEDGMSALAAAADAQRAWGASAPRDRAEILRRAFETVTARADDFALLMTLEMGKPLAEARGEVTYGAEFLRWFSEEAARISGRYATAPDGKARLMVHKRPVGPSLFITPWNFPLAMATRKIAPAIAAGCTMVVKPATLTPLTTLLFARVMEEVGLPKGVLNVIPTSNAGAVTGPIIKDPRLRKLSFTGSTEVGRSLLKDSADQILRTSMELGGNAPFLVFEDADIDSAVEGAMLAKMRNMGEACTAANRFIVHDSVADEFARKLAERMAGLTLKRGTEDDAKVGPLIDEKSRQKVQELVDDAVAKGADVRTGGKPTDGPGYFYPPTVLSGVGSHARILAEEVFGPVAPIITFSEEEKAVELANDTEFGLVAYAYTRDVARSLRLADTIESGMLGLNVGIVSNPAAPFGGVKQSGLGREGGFEGIEEFLETKYVGLADPFADVQKA
ncbi:MAG TPA: NAD-dependent succinate-semialdehyde dehydrogenase [Nocardioidaceae bacterium]